MNMDYLQYVESDSYLNKLDPRTKFVFFVVMAIVTSVVKSLVALVFLGLFLLVIWITSKITKEMLTLLNKLKVLLIFILLLWLVLGIFEEPPVTGGPVFVRTDIGKIHICFDWYDIYKGLVYSLRIYLMIASFTWF